VSGGLVLAIVGPTGAGKSELAAELARRIDGEIIGCDSMQVYRGMDIGTAKPGPELRREIPHHVIDVVDPDEQMSAGRYAALARAAARDVLARGKRPILCGGTGLYARAFRGGLVPGLEARPDLRERLRARSTESLLAALRACDPASAERIGPGDRVRIERALEIAGEHGRPASSLRSEHAFSDRPFDLHFLGLELPRDELWRRIATRVERMFREGLVEEVRALWRAGFTRRLPPLRSIGYREVGWLLDGRIDEEAARERIRVATRRYAKRQRTWFRAEPGLRWINAADLEAALARILELSPR
jgi:tRNA dimethylallyltransferase